MKPPPPDVLRRGALVRVAGGPDDARAAAFAYAFLDLRFDDGHVERWLGPGSSGELPSGPAAMASLQAWARDAVCELAFDIMCDVARHYDVPSPRVLWELPCDEVVVEWRTPPPEF